MNLKRVFGYAVYILTLVLLGDAWIDYNADHSLLNHSGINSLFAIGCLAIVSMMFADIHTYRLADALKKTTDIHEKLVDEYDKLVDKYNELVDECNELKDEMKDYETASDCANDCEKPCCAWRES